MKKTYKETTIKVFKCLLCAREHETEQEAKECAQPTLPAGVKEGDWIVDRNRKVWEVATLDMPNKQCRLHRVNEMLWFRGRTARDTQMPSVSWVQRFSCGSSGKYKKLTADDIKSELLQLRRRIKIGERILAKIGKGE